MYWNVSYAQADSTKSSISYYLDDGGISTAKNVVKLNLAAIIYGEIPITYERALGDRFSLEVGIGLQLPYYNSELTTIEKEDEIKDPQSGFGIWIFPKYYLHAKAPELNYIGILYRRMEYQLKNEEVIYRDFTYNYGIQTYIHDRLVFDGSIGTGFRSTKYPNQTTNEPDNWNLLVSIGLKLGYLF